MFKKMTFVESEVVYIIGENDEFNEYDEEIIAHYARYGGRDFGSGTMLVGTMTRDISFEFQGRGALRRAKRCVKTFQKTFPDVNIENISLVKTTNYDTKWKE